MSNHASDLSKAEEILEDLMEERWLKAQKKVEEKILRKKNEAREKEAAEAKRIADEKAAKAEAKRIADEEAATSMIFGWLKIFLGTMVGAGTLYALWRKYCRPKRGSDVVGASASAMAKPNDGSGHKLDARPRGGNVFKSIQAPSTIDTATTAGAVAGAAIMKQTTTKQQTQKGQRQRKWKQNLASVGDNNNHGSVNTTAFDPEDANKKMWDERSKKLQEKKLEATQKKQQLEAAEQQKKAVAKTEQRQKAAKEKQEVIVKAEQQWKAEEARKKEEASAAEAKRVTDDGGGNDGETDVDALSWDQRLNTALDNVQHTLAGEVEETWV
jgi:hypothetical protein